MEKSKKSNSSIFEYVVLSALAIWGLIIAICLFMPCKVIIDVDSAYWQSQINVQRFNTYKMTDVYLPVNAKLISIEDKVIGYDRELSYYQEGEKTVDEDGFTHVEQIPVYTNKPIHCTEYNYTISKWEYERSIIEQGTKSEPYYGELDLGDKEKEMGRFTNYYVHGVATYKPILGNSYKVNRNIRINKDDVYNIEPGQSIEATVAFNKVISWKPIEEETL